MSVLASPRLRAATYAIGAGTLATVMAATALNTASTTIATDLGASLVEVQWISTSYLLALGAAIALSGWATRRFGARRVWETALWTFLAGSLLCTFAWSAESLTAFRVVQGLGGGLVLPVGQTILVRLAGPRGVASALSALALINLLGPTFGPLAGGFAVDVLSWRWLFVAGIPVSLLALFLVRRVVPAERGESGVPFDLVGAALLVPGLALVTVGLTQLTARGGAAGPLLAGAIGAALLIAFCAHAVRRGEHAVLDVRLLARRELAGSAMITMIFGALLFGGLMLLPLFWELLRGRSPFDAGLLMLPQGLGSLFALLLLARMRAPDRAAPVVIAGLLLSAAVTLPYALAPADMPAGVLSALLAVRGFGVSLVLTPALVVAYAALSGPDVPLASALTNVLLRLGGSLGTALTVALVQARLPDAEQAFRFTFLAITALTLAAIPPALLLRPRRRALRPIQST